MASLFTNYSDQEFIGYWDGKPYKFKAGQSKYMPDWMARHFAKHLTNQELLRRDINGNEIHKDGEKMTSPKFPEQVPVFMEFFNKAYTPDETAVKDEIKSDLDVELEVLNKPSEPSVESSIKPVADEFENQPIE